MFYYAAVRKKGLQGSLMYVIGTPSPSIYLNLEKKNSWKNLYLK